MLLTWCLGNESLQYASAQSSQPYANGAQNTDGRLTHRDGINHDARLCDPPAHDDRAGAQMVLERRPKYNEAYDVQRDRDVARPVVVERQENDIRDGVYVMRTYQRRLSASNTPLLRLMLQFMIPSFMYRPINSPMMTETCAHQLHVSASSTSLPKPNNIQSGCRSLQQWRIATTRN